MTIYSSKGGIIPKGHNLVKQIMNELKDKIYCFKSVGLATLVMHQKKASTMFQLHRFEEEDD